MKNLQNIKQLKLANINLITQNQCTNQTKIRMMINGQISLVNIMPKWKFDRIKNQAKYFSTDNYNEKKDEKINNVNKSLDNNNNGFTEIEENDINDETNLNVDTIRNEMNNNRDYLNIFSDNFCRINEDFIDK